MGMQRTCRHRVLRTENVPSPHPHGTTLHVHLGRVGALCSWLVGRVSEDKFREESTKARSFISSSVLNVVAMQHGLIAFCSVS